MITTQMLNENIFGIAIGLRFNRTFAIGDNLGKIADRILYSKNSYFNPEFFPQVDSGINNILLRDELQNRYLAISTTDIILEVKKIAEQAYDIATLENNYEKQILHSILSDYQVRDIKRIGYLIKYKISDESISKAFCTKFKVDTDNLSMRFQKNYPMPDAMSKKDVNDYCTNIYTITKVANSNELIIHSDYQIHFEPFLDNYNDINYQLFLKAKNQFHEKKLPEFLTSYFTT